MWRKAGECNLMKKRKNVLEYRPWKRWTQREEDLLRELYPVSFNHELEERFGRPARNIGAKAIRIGLKKGWIEYDSSQTHKNKPWSKKEINRLKKLFATLPNEQLLLHFPGRSIGSLKGKAVTLGLRKNNRNVGPSYVQLPAKLRIWSAKDIKKLRSLWQQGYNKIQISQMMGKTAASIDGQISKQIREFGLPKRIEYTPWSAEEDAYMIEHYKNTPSSQLSNILGRTINAIQRRARLLHLSSEALRTWTKKEMRFLKDHYETWTKAQIAEKLGRSIDSIRGKVETLGLEKAFNSWTEKEIAFLKKHYKTLSCKQIADKLGNRTSEAVQLKAAKLGLKKETVWTLEEMDFLKKHHETLSCEKIAEKLVNRTPVAIHVKAKKLGLRKKTEYL